MFLAEFARHKNDLPVDYGHQTLGGEYAAPDGIPKAAGWISKLWFSGTDGGLRALVSWTDRAREMIQADELRYPSPVFLVRKSDRRAVALHSVALTNKPAIPAMERVAASDSRTEKTGTKTQDTEVITMAEGIQDNPAPTPSGSDSGAPSYASLGFDDADSDAEKVKKLLELVGELQAKLKKAEGSEEVASSVRKELGVKEDAKEAEVLLALANQTKVTADKDGEIVAMRSELEQVKAAQMSRDTNEFIANGVSAGKILAGDDKRVEWWKSFFADDRKRAEETLANSAVIVPQGRTTPPPGGAPRKGDRKTIIANALKEFGDNPGIGKWTSRQAHVNCVLAEGHGLAVLTEAESNEL